ncbi:MAG: amino acid adenylation domain-containing protein, partial [Acidobacteriota bacterium]|nr:amino acid adenylation domain-containing protein [Acidobacteriota bacterium]
AEGCTLFMTLLAGYSALLSRYSGQEQVVVGSPIANRTRPETEGLIGFFVNTLALRADLSGNPTFTELLRQVREATLGAYAHQEVPFERLVEELAPERSLSHHPLFQAALSLQNAPREAAELPGLRMRPWESEGGTTKFDLLLAAGETAGGGLSGSWEYSTDLFEAATVERMHRGLLRLLAEAAADPERPVADIDLLTEDERRQCVLEWNRTETRYAHQHFIDLFEEQVALRPDAVAAECGRESLTYAELDRRANRLARRLRGLGAGRGTLVGVLLERSADAVVSVLGVLKSGAAYVPLDPSHPSARLAAILDDTASPLVLTVASLADLVPEAAGRRVLDINSAEECERLSLEDDSPLARASGPGDLAYVIYTSGSTGRPKGVQIEHRSLANYLSWARSLYADGRPLSFALLSSLAYDLSATALYVPLVTGGRVVAFKGEARDGVLDEALAHPHVEALKLTPSHLRLLAERDNRASAARVLVVGGEALPEELARKTSESFGGRVEIYNEYGPTEATVGCSVHRHSSSENAADGDVPVGRPAANTRLYVLDARMRPAPLGVAGELYIGGDCLARGYLNRPELTAERFVADPFAGEAGARLYRTGDLARWLASGELEYLGRRDGQLKVRGVRIEREEVRAAVLLHPSVRDCVVAVRANARGEAALVCYYVARREVEAAELRAQAAARVVAEAVPEGWVHLRRMPLTLNGKVDEAALPQWAGGAAAASARGAGESARTTV